jgi:hypothetical protein
MLSCNAGLEHTARGGRRVHTQVLVLDEPNFHRFQCDPLLVETGVYAMIGRDPPLKPPAQLKPISLSTEVLPDEPAATHAPAARAMDGLITLLSAVLEGRRLLVLGVPEPRDVLRWLWDVIPPAVRARLSLSCGLKFSPTRKFQLILVGNERRETERLANDQGVDVLHWDSPSPPVNSNFAVWLGFVRSCWESERTDELRYLVTRLTEECSAQELELVATLCMDIDQLMQADPPQVEKLIRKHSRTVPTTSIQKCLLDDFRETADMRQSSSEDR